MKVGDVVGMVYGMPGPDITYCVVIRVEGDRVWLWDVFFDLEMANRPTTGLWLASEKELDSGTEFHTSKRSGRYTVRQLADEKRATLTVEGGQ